MQHLRILPFAPLLIAACVLGTGTFALFATKSRAADEKTPTARPALTITVVQPQRTHLPLKLAANGSIAAWQEASVGSEANGLRLSEVHVNVGDVVKKGQLLARFADEAVQADLAQARAGLLEAEAQAAEAAANAERARTLQATGALSAQQISQYATAEQTAKARVEAARATLTTQQLRLKYTQVPAPDSGVISARLATVGAVVGAGTELFRLIRQGRLEWRAEVVSAEIGRLPPGTQATVTAASGARLTGRVRKIAPTVDPQTRSGLVYVDLPPLGAQTPGTAGAALPGMFARGEFELGGSDALTVPQQAVVLRDGFSYVFRLNPDLRVTRLKVQTGRLAGERVEILTGLPADARVVASGAGFLNDGDLVRLADAAAPAAAAAAAR
ncbi:efflux RND transporter periplasmic adaptor subunit [Variovorax terrae]|uniref:Efflux RND transporter periplasmic adaptor subunit n=1 Tax=Variovorax terrae TaxID=2923278 RepID=A0A9X1W109_9BURK|nr:efflux RND transporter periplasmic adaptor subunit [Variovorax terrae]MCJ0765824.1 efflux RND transporter periplasmic adaptor subunit [Variovorax terrae]